MTIFEGVTDFICSSNISGNQNNSLAGEVCLVNNHHEASSTSFSIKASSRTGHKGCYNVESISFGFVYFLKITLVFPKDK